MQCNAGLCKLKERKEKWNIYIYMCVCVFKTWLTRIYTNMGHLYQKDFMLWFLGHVKVGFAHACMHVKENKVYIYIY